MKTTANIERYEDLIMASCLSTNVLRSFFKALKLRNLYLFVQQQQNFKFENLPTADKLFPFLINHVSIRSFNDSHHQLERTCN